MQNIIDPLKDGLSSIKLITSHPTENDICKIIRVCYDKDYDVYSQEKNVELLKHIVEQGHTSTLEHSLLTFEVKCPVFVSRQWCRHRIGTAWTEKSGRYTKFNDETYIPSGITEFQEAKFREVIGLANVNYRMLINDGCPKEKARIILTLGLYTHFYWSCNLRSFLHFQELRNTKKTQEEIKLYAQAMLNLLDIDGQFNTNCGIIKDKVGEK